MDDAAAWSGEVRPAGTNRGRIVPAAAGYAEVQKVVNRVVREIAQALVGRGRRGAGPPRNHPGRCLPR